MSQEIIDRIFKVFNEHEEGVDAFAYFAGVRLTAMGEGWAEGEVEINSHHLRPGGMVNGGLIYTLADVLGGYCGLTTGIKADATISSHIVYMNAARDTKKIKARAKIIKNGRTIITVEVEVFDDRDKILAILTGVYANISRPKAE